MSKYNNERYILPGLKGKSVVVTGGACGIGKRIVLEFIRQGSFVSVLDKDEIAAKRLVDDLSNYSNRVLFIKCDITKEYDVTSCMEIVNKRFNSIDILVNNAGITFNCPFEDLTLEDWENVIKINLTGAFICSKAVYPYMVKKSSGCIIMISSGSAITGSGGSVAYSASKGGVNSLVRALSRELAPMGIRVNGVAPRSIQGELLEKLYSKVEIENMKGKIPLRRLGTDMDVANVVVFLASELAGFITGEVILVDGGRTFGC